MKHFCLPTDFRELTEGALPFIARFIKKMDANLHLVHAVPPAPVSPITAMPEYTAEIGRIVEGWLNDLKGKFVTLGVDASKIETTWWMGSCDDEVVDYCKQNAVDALIIPTNNRTGLAKAFMGSHAIRLLQNSRIPLLVITPEVAKAYADKDIATVGFPTDFSELSLKGLDDAISTAHGLGARLDIVHAIQDVLDWAGIYGDALDIAAAYGSYDELADKTRHEALDRLNKIQTEVRGKNASLNTEVRLVDSPAEEGIVSWAKSHPDGMIVMTSHGYSGFTNFVMGSVAEDIITNASCPVLVTRPKAD